MTNKKYKPRYIPLLGLLLLSSACVSTPPANTPGTILPTAIVSSTFVPTHIPDPTTTFQPSSTLPPTVMPTPLVAGAGQVIFSESFNNLQFPFNIYGPERIEPQVYNSEQLTSGILVLEREEGYQPPPDMWPTGGIYGRVPIPPGTITIILFKAKSGTEFNIGYHTGVYGTETLRRFCFTSGSGMWDLYEGTSATPIKSWKARLPSFDTWNYFSITRSASGDIDARIWEQDKPETMFRFQGNLGAEWGKLPLTFVADFRWGSFMLDEYQDLK